MAKKRTKGKGSQKPKGKAKKKTEEEAEPKVIEEEEEYLTKEDEVPETSGGSFLWVIPLLSILVLLWILTLKLDLIPRLYFDASDQIPIGIAAAVQIVFLVVLTRAYQVKAERSLDRALMDEEEIEKLKRTYVDHEEDVGRTSKGSDVEGEELLEPEIIEAEVIEEAPEPEEKRSEKGDKWGLIEYPPKIPGGVYSDTLVPVGRGRILKLRTIVARACMICDKQVECWPKARKYISKEDFKFNTECKGGLRRLGVKDI